MSHQTRQYSFTCLGVALAFSGPAKSEDIARITGNPSACEEAFMLNLYAYQDRNPAVREGVVKKLIESTGVARLTKTTPVEGKEDKVEFSESEVQYINRLTSDGVITEVDVATFANEVNNSLGDWSPSTGGRSSKPAKKFYELADSVLVGIATGTIGKDGDPTTAEKVQANIESKLNASFDMMFGEFNRDNLARALKELQERAERAAASIL